MSRGARRGVGFTGLGSLPGVDFPAALRMTFDKVAGLPYLPELPSRGPWAELVGRGLGLLAGLDAELVAGEWRLGFPGIDHRRSRATWRDDLEQLEEQAQGYAGSFKISIAGPWTLAAATGVAHAGRVLADPGARRDLAASLAEGVGELVSDLHRRLPALELVLQVDEPALPAVLGGNVPTEGGFFRFQAVDRAEVAAGLAALTAEPARRGVAVDSVVHCCAPGLPIEDMLGQGREGAGFGAVSLDLDTIAADQYEPLAAGVEAGAGVWLGCVPTHQPLQVTADEVRGRVLRFIETLGVADALAERLVLTPACGMAGFTPDAVSRTFGVLAVASRQVAEELGGQG
ncbi:MAG: methionine synthase [Propionicimonas sp.]